MQDNIAENVEDLQPVDRSAVIIRTMVRSVYDLQGIRIQMGNRITANWKSKLGLMSEGLNEAQLEKQEKKVLKQLRDDYKRITDGIIKEGDDAASKIPTARKWAPPGVVLWSPWRGLCATGGIILPPPTTLTASFSSAAIICVWPTLACGTCRLSAIRR